MRIALDALLADETIPNPEKIRVVAGSPAVRVATPLGPVLTEFPIYWVKERALDIREADMLEDNKPSLTSLSLNSDVTIAVVR